jgi:hypothetical protein
VFRGGIACVLALLALALAACGGGDDQANDYRQEIREVQQRYFADLERYAADATDQIGVDSEAASRALEQYAATATKLADAIDRLEAPEDAQAPGDRLVASYRALAASSNELRTALASGDAAAVDEAVAGFNSGQADLAAAVEDLNAVSG